MLGFPLLLNSTTLVWYQLWTRPTAHPSGNLMTFFGCNQIHNRAIRHFLAWRTQRHTNPSTVG